MYGSGDGYRYGYVYGYMCGYMCGYGYKYGSILYEVHIKPYEPLSSSSQAGIFWEEEGRVFNSLFCSLDVTA